MTTQQLLCFLHVADRLNFTKAAKELFLSVPTVTHHIQSLEEELGAKLLIRTSRKVQLTPAGVSFYHDAREIFDKIQVSVKHIHNLDRRGIQLLRIGCVTNTELDRLACPLEQLRVQFPNIQPQFVVDDYFKLEKMFENKQLDLIISTSEMVGDLSFGQFIPVRTVREYAIMAIDSPFNQKTEFQLDPSVECALITLHPRFLPFRNGDKLHRDILFYIQKHVHLICENDHAAILLARCGYGVAILSEIFLPKDQSGLAVLPVTHAFPTEYGFMVQSKETHIEYLIEQYQNFNNLKDI